MAQITTTLVGPPASTGPQSVLPMLTDVSALPPDQQAAWLQQMLDEADNAAPVSNTLTPPGNEYDLPDDWIPEPVLDESYLPAPDLDTGGVPMVDAVHAAINEPPTSEFEVDWYNDLRWTDAQFLPFESGQTQNVLRDPTNELGWDDWSGKHNYVRPIPHKRFNPHWDSQFDRFPSYAGVYPQWVPYYDLTQQRRDLLLATLKARGIHEVIITDVEPTTNTMSIPWVDPTALPPEAAIGPEGVLP